MTLEEALVRVERLLGITMEWSELNSFLPETQDSGFRKSALASSFVAALELARKGKLELDQEAASPRSTSGRMNELPDDIRAVEATLFAARSR
jgi:chromatin segregation and condensation protein Rec8/ScpA/Scc1 (kleisin family)